MIQANRVKQGRKIETFLYIALNKKVKSKPVKNPIPMSIIQYLVDRYGRG